MSEFADFDLCGPLYYGSKVNCVPYIAVLVLICLFSVEENTHILAVSIMSCASFILLALLRV
jgi:hypothetical protein